MSPATRRAVGLVLVALTLAVACTFLGRWQWNRHVWRDGAIAIVQANWSAAPVPLDTILATPDVPLADDDVWRRVVVVGHYEPAATALLRNRPVDGNAVYHVLVPFVVEDASGGTAATPTQAGTVLLIDRGWVATGETSNTVVVPSAPPSGTVTLTTRLRQDEPAANRSAPAGQVQAISVAQVLAATPAGTDLADADVYAAYGGLSQESPAAASPLGPLPPPSTDPGSHLSYAFQWWTFALGSLVAFTYMARRELLEERYERAELEDLLTGADDAGTATSPGPRGAGSVPDPLAEPGPDHRPGSVPGPLPASAPGLTLWPTRDTPGRRPTDRRRRPTSTPPGPRRRGGRDEDAEDALIDAQLERAELTATPRDDHPSA